jgi:hypothetical protein
LEYFIQLKPPCILFPHNHRLNDRRWLFLLIHQSTNRNGWELKYVRCHCCLLFCSWFRNFTLQYLIVYFSHFYCLVCYVHCKLYTQCKCHLPCRFSILVSIFIPILNSSIGPQCTEMIDLSVTKSSFARCIRATNAFMDARHHVICYPSRLQAPMRRRIDPGH